MAAYFYVRPIPQDSRLVPPVAGELFHCAIYLGDLLRNHQGALDAAAGGEVWGHAERLQNVWSPVKSQASNQGA
jgi:hypothetical protein